ncbi:MAG: DUF1501 domain-containing protein [Planctomycetaceae bacterium]|nr:DUF1501 domain-containing protein [Planctomycetales bacterium]MCB9940927.1 DUF1501 domain-containing protein [Planctomycetaceae bacterium]
MKQSCCSSFTNSSFVNRRRLLQAGGLSLFGLGLPELLAADVRQPLDASFGRAKSCILLFMWGGPAHQDTWDLKPDAPVEVRGEFKPISTNVPGIQICEHFPELATRTDQLAIVRSMTHTDVNHTSGTHYMLTGEPPPANTDVRVQWPHVGSVLAALDRGRGALPPFVSMRPELENDVPRFVEQSQGQFAGWLGSVYDPLTIDHDPSRDDYHVADLTLQPEVSARRLLARNELRASLNARSSQLGAASDTHDANSRRAIELLTSAAGQRGAFDLEQEPPAVRERYGMNPHGQSVLQARRLVERGVPLVTIFWPSDGIKNVSVYWDTHSRNFIDLKERLMPVADQAFSALLDDLSQRGMLDETLVVWTGEFGRTPKVGQRNSDAGAGKDGRDHWPGCFTSVLAGGGVRGGTVYGKSDRHAAFPAADPVAPRDLIATVYHALGVPAGQTLNDTSGRPHFVRPGNAIQDLFA